MVTVSDPFKGENVISNEGIHSLCLNHPVIVRDDVCFAWVGQNHFKPASQTNYHQLIINPLDEVDCFAGRPVGDELLLRQMLHHRAIQFPGRAARDGDKNPIDV